jgi:excinuclease UvrABC nuclease subunit
MQLNSIKQTIHELEHKNSVMQMDMETLLNKLKKLERYFFHSFATNFNRTIKEKEIKINNLESIVDVKSSNHDRLIAENNKHYQVIYYLLAYHLELGLVGDTNGIQNCNC